MRMPPRAHLLDGLGPDIEVQKAGMNLVRVFLGCLPSIPAHGHGLCPEDAPDGLARVSDRVVGAPFIDPYIYSPEGGNRIKNGQHTVFPADLEDCLDWAYDPRGRLVLHDKERLPGRVALRPLDRLLDLLRFYRFSQTTPYHDRLPTPVLDHRDYHFREVSVDAHERFLPPGDKVCDGHLHSQLPGHGDYDDVVIGLEDLLEFRCGVIVDLLPLLSVVREYWQCECGKNLWFGFGRAGDHQQGCETCPRRPRLSLLKLGDSRAENVGRQF